MMAGWGIKSERFAADGKFLDARLRRRAVFVPAIPPIVRASTSGPILTASRPKEIN
jgi:hypothetical protein